MTGQQLKNSILQLAIQGKLVAQDPNDEPASELLKRIRKEKEQLVKEGKLKKKDLVSTPIADDEKPFEIPKGWVWCRMGEIITLLSGQDLTPDRYFDSERGLPYITGASHFVNGSLTINRWTETPTSVSHIGDLLITCKGTVGTMAYNKIGDMHIARQVMAISSVIVAIRYIEKFLVLVVPKLEKQARSIIPGISRDILLNTLIPLPPLAEQHRIVEKIGQLLPLVEKFGKAQEELNALNKSLPESLKKSILQEAIMGRLVPQDPNEEPASVLLRRIRKEKEQLVKEGKLKKKDLVSTPIADEEKPFEIPKSWEWCRLGEICCFLSRGRSPKYADHIKQYPVFAQKCNLKEGGISLEQARFLDPSSIGTWKEEYKLKDGDVLVNSTGTGTVGRTRLFDSSCLGDYPFVVPDSHVSVVRTFEKISSSYIYFCLISFFLQQYFEDNLAGSTNQKELYIGTLAETPIPLPPLSEQHRIVAKLEEILPKLEKL